MTRVATQKRPDEARERVEKYLIKIPEMRKPLMVRVFDGKSSPREAIKAKCYDCVGFEDIAANVYDCRSYTCPIWGLRPKPKKK